MEAIGLVSQLATTAAVCGAAFILLREQPLPEQVGLYRVGSCAHMA